MPDLDDLLHERVRAHTPGGLPPFDGIRATALRRRRRRTVLGVAAAATVLAAGGVAAFQVASGPSGGPAEEPPTAAGPSHGTGPDTGPRTGPDSSAPTGALGEGASTSLGSCIEEYTPQGVTGRAFAFDGVVTAIGESVSGRADDGSGGNDLDLAGVTFEVREWYAGGSGATVTVDLPPPTEQAVRSDGAQPSYGPGTRLLVSGESRWGGRDPLAAPIAWTCGFTRYHDESTAAAWAAVFGGAS